jgi:CysZ protein
MLTALFRAIEALGLPALRRVVALSLAIAVVSFVALWTGVALALQHLPTVGWRPLNWLIDVLGLGGVLVLSWLLFPAVLTLVMGFYLERVATAVDALYYPGRGPPRRQSIRETVASSFRLMLVSIALNLLALPIYLTIPGLNIVVYLGLNGYLLGREYFEIAALRRLDIDGVKQVRLRFRGRTFLGGVIIAGLFAVPLVNLVAPIIAVAFMVQVFERLPGSASAGINA